MTKEQKVKALISNSSTRFTEKDREWLMGLAEDTLDRLAPVEVTVNAEEREPRVKALIDAEQYAADDRGWLMTCAAAVFDKLETKAKTAMKAIVDNAKTKIDKAITGGRFQEEDREWLMKLNADQLNRTLAGAVVAEKPKTAEDFLKTAPPDIRDVLTNALSSEKQRRGRILDALKKNESCLVEDAELDAMSTNTLEALAESFEIEDYSGAGGNADGIVDNEKIPAPPKLERRKAS